MKCSKCGHIGRPEKMTKDEKALAISSGMLNAENIGRPRIRPPDELAHILKREGFSIRESAFQLRVSPTTIQNMLRVPVDKNGKEG